MIKNLSTSKKIILSAFFVCTLLSSNQSFAQVCPSMGAPCEAPYTLNQAFTSLKSTVKSAIKTSKTALEKAVDANKKTITKAHDVMDITISMAANSLGQTMTNNAASMMKSSAKVMDTYHTKYNIDVRKEFKQFETGISLQPSSNDCIVNTAIQTKPQQETLTEGIAELLFDERLTKRQNPEGKSSIERKAEEYQEYISTFCDPDMPNAPEECSQTIMTNTHKNVDMLVGDITIETLDAKAPIDKMISSFVPNIIDRQSLPSFQTAAGQRQYIRAEAQKMYAAFLESRWAEAAAQRLPTSDTRAAINSKKALTMGSDSPQALQDYHASKNNVKVSKAEQRKVDQAYKMSQQKVLDSIQLSESGAARAKIHTLIDTLQSEYDAYKQDVQRNIMLAIRYAGSV